MRNQILVLIVVGSLVGLGFIQFHLLKVGILLEKQRFDTDIRSVLEQFSLQLNQNEIKLQQFNRLYAKNTE